MATMLGQGRVISNFALMHFRAAQHFATLTHDLEIEHANQPLGSH
jgi:hypothetical protein